MSKPVQLPTPEDVAAIRAFAERQLSPEEFDAYVNAPMSDEEREEMLSLIEWFTRRYPTPYERLEWARRTYERMKRAMPPSSE